MNKYLSAMHTNKLNVSPSARHLTDFYPMAQKSVTIEPRAKTKIYIYIEYLICYTQGGV